MVLVEARRPNAGTGVAGAALVARLEAFAVAVFGEGNGTARNVK